jgi:hypothetical protein
VIFLVPLDNEAIELMTRGSVGDPGGNDRGFVDELQALTKTPEICTARKQQ